MKNFSSLEDKAFSFIRVPARSAKPREEGLTIFADKGLGLRQMEDTFETVGEFIDWAKVCIGTPRIYTRDFLKKKIDFYHENQINVFISGDAFDLSVLQGVADKYFQECVDLGADGVEVASAQILLSTDDKARLVEKAASMGLKVIAEVGKKGLEEWAVYAGSVLKDIETFKNAGAYKVLVQGEGLVEGVKEIKEKPLFEIQAKYGIKDLIFQAKDNRAHQWFITNFGLEVSLDVDSDQVMGLELMRRAVRKRGIFGLVASYPE